MLDVLPPKTRALTSLILAVPLVCIGLVEAVVMWALHNAPDAYYDIDAPDWAEWSETDG